jgi:hypothetical protein
MPDLKAFEPPTVCLARHVGRSSHGEQSDVDAFAVSTTRPL